MPLTLAEAKDSRLNRISGVCATSTEFLEFLNDATRQLMRRGNWWGTVIKMRVCVYSDCFSLPAYVGTVLAVNVNNSVVPVSNHWFEFMSVDKSDWCCNRIWNSNVAAEIDGNTPVFQNAPCAEPQQIRAYPQRQADLGKVITVFGIDQYGNPVRTTHADGTFAEGEEMVLVLPYVAASTWFRTITRVIKPITDGPVDMFMYNPVGDTLLEMAHYQPGDTNPWYRHMRIHRYGVASNTCCCPTSVTILAKLAFVPVRTDNDLVLIDNLDALAMAMQAIKQSDAYDHKQSEMAMMRAVHELNLDLRDKFPNDSVPVNVSPYGTASLSRQGIGSLM